VLAATIQLHRQNQARYGLEGRFKALGDSNFDLESFSFGVRDAFTYAIIVAAKRTDKNENENVQSMTSPRDA